jgi:carboxymethylenebutenolidase
VQRTGNIAVRGSAVFNAFDLNIGGSKEVSKRHFSNSQKHPNFARKKNTMILRKVFLFVGFVGLLAACKNDPKSDDMTQFGEDKEFQAIHGLPDSINFKPQGRMTQFNAPGTQNGQAYIVRTQQPSNKYLLVFHEWWGLNQYIQREADRLFNELKDVNVVAIDLYDGKRAKTAEEATQYMSAVNDSRANALIGGILNMAGPDAKIATVGWCFGGGWSLKGAILGADRVKGAVMYYGMPVQNAGELAPLQAEVLGIFAKKDQWITPEVVDKFEDLAKATGKTLQVQEFDADHAFANPSQPSFDKTEAAKANELALNFLKEKLQ